MTFEKELESLLNRHCKENGSNTPDFILVQYLIGCLAVWNQGVQQRDTWYDRDVRLAFLARKATSGAYYEKSSLDSPRVAENHS